PLVGQGSCGTVHMGISKDSTVLPTIMAVKSANMSDARSLKRERKILSKLEGCPSVIQCYGEDITLDEDGKTVYNLLLEFAYGGTLTDLIDKSGGCGLPEPQVRFYTRCILEGLSKVHEFGYVHCDLKPDNILLDKAGLLGATNNVAKICDFGMAKKANKRTSLRGSPMYVSPEILNFGSQESASDIWALGCVVLKMLTGKPPWILETDLKKDPDLVMRDLFSRIGSTHELPVIPSNISEESKDFLRCCFPKSPALRSTASELLNHKFVMAFEEEGEKKGREREEVLDPEGINTPLSSTYEEDSFISLKDSSSASPSEGVSSSSPVPDVFPIFTNTSVKQAALKLRNRKCQELAAADNGPPPTKNVIMNNKIILQSTAICRKNGRILNKEFQPRPIGLKTL
ncbi:unnamed protein product, partial [Dovyalis caffra]